MLPAESLEPSLHRQAIMGITTQNSPNSVGACSFLTGGCHQTLPQFFSRLCHCVRVKHLSCLFTFFLRRARFEKSEVPKGQNFSFPVSDLEIWKCKTMHLFIFSSRFLKMERETSRIPKNREKTMDLLNVSVVAMLNLTHLNSLCLNSLHSNLNEVNVFLCLTTHITNE